MAASRANDASTGDKRQREIINCPWEDGRGGGQGRQLELLDVIRKGSYFYTLYSCRDTVTHEKYLAKRVCLQGVAERDRQYREKEISIWLGLRHRHILTCLAGWQSGADLWLLSQAASQTVEGVVRDKGLPPPQPLFEQWLYQLASALQYLHEFQDRPILHRNLKQSNVMVVPHFLLKLTDFGCAKELPDREAMTSSRVGTASIMSPEVVKGQAYSTKADMWSMGITAVFIATQQQAISATTLHTLVGKIRKGEVRGIAGHYSTDIQSLVHSLVQKDPQNRPSASEFITDLRLCSEDCAKPTTAHSYPGRQLVPQLPRQGSSGASPKHPASGNKGSGPKSGSRSAPEQQGRAQGREDNIPGSWEDAEGSAGGASIKKGTKSTAREKCQAACQTTQSLLLDDDPRPKSAAAEDDRAVLSLVVSTKDRQPRSESTVQGRDLNRLPCKEYEAKARRGLPSAERPDPTTGEIRTIQSENTGGGGELPSNDRTAQSSGRKKSASIQQHEERGVPASAERKASLTGSSKERTLPSSHRRRSEPSGHYCREETPDVAGSRALEVPLPAQNHRCSKRRERAFSQTTPTNSFDEETPASRGRQSEEDKRLFRQSISSAIDSHHADKSAAPSRARNVRNERALHAERVAPPTHSNSAENAPESGPRCDKESKRAHRGRNASPANPSDEILAASNRRYEDRGEDKQASDVDGGEPAPGHHLETAKYRKPPRKMSSSANSLEESASSHPVSRRVTESGGYRTPAARNSLETEDKSFGSATEESSEGAGSTQHVRGPCPEYGRDDSGVEDWQDVASLTSDTMTSDISSSDVVSSGSVESEPQWLSTFPGAFNVARASPADRRLSLHHAPAVRAGEDSSTRERRSRAQSEGNTSQPARGAGGTRSGGGDSSDRPHTPLLFEAPVDSWPENMRQYWIITQDLVQRLGAETFFTAFQYAKLSSEVHVRDLLHNQGISISSAAQCAHNLKQLVELDTQLDARDARTVSAFTDTLMTACSRAGDGPA